MNTATTDDLARASLAHHAHEGAFTVPVVGEEEGEALAHAFERLGCHVEPEPFNFQLRVTVGKGAQIEA